MAAVVALGPSVAEVPAGAESAPEPGPSTGGTTESRPPGETPAQKGPTRAYLPDLQQFLDDQATLLGDRWAGSSVLDDGTALVGLTAGPIPPVLTAHPQVRVVTRRFSSNHLDATIKTVAERLNALLNPGVAPGTPGKWPYEARVDLKESVVTVIVDENRKGDEARIRNVLADELAVGSVRIEYGTMRLAMSNYCLGRSVCDTPWRGGTAITNAYGASCMSGFVMKDWAGVRYQSTAGHCSPGPWSHNGVQIGFTAWALDSGSVDGRIVYQNNQSQNAPRNWVYRPGNNASAVLSKVVNPSTTLDTTVCMQGQYEEQCGPIYSTNSTVRGREGFGLHDSPVTCKGDSGGATLGASDNRAYGFHTGGFFDFPEQTCSFNEYAYFSWTANIEAASGYQVLLKSTTETLGPGQRMHGGEEIRSTTGYYALVMQTDGNLVLYGPSGLVWATNTVGNPGAFVTMQNAGNLVVYSAGNTPLWARPASGYIEGSRLVVQNDRNVVIYSPTGLLTWATNTNI